MCSIMGFLEKKAKNASEEVLRGMMKILLHRGPDDAGLERCSIFGSDEKNLAIGFNRLSIRDLSPQGHQPMWNYTHNIFITFNGEIYNADDYRNDLIQKDYTFRGHSDTEVILYLYEEYGIDGMLERLDGMFSICITDLRKDTIYLCRDRLGEKPLYIYENSDIIIWASEYKAFYCHPSFHPQLNEEAVTEYFLYRFVAGGETLLKGVKNIAPGTYLELSKDGIQKIVYWDLPGIEDKTISYEQCKKDLQNLMKQSVRRRLVSDVKVGVQLSGGIDSSYVTRIAADVSSHGLDTFGIVLENENFNEKEYMDQVSSLCNTRHHSIPLSKDKFLALWKETTFFFEAPMNHEGSLGLLYLNREARKDVTVLLCGDGADEVLGGYDRFPGYAYQLKNSLVRVASILKRYHRWPFELGTLIGSPERHYLRNNQFINTSCVRKLYPKADIDHAQRKRLDILMKLPGKGIRQYMNYDIVTYMQDILMRSDKCSMASSMELRVPFLMPKLVEYAATIPTEYLAPAAFHDPVKISRNSKKILKEIVSEIFGENFAYREKMGFSIGLMDYLKQDEVIQFIETVLLPGMQARHLLDAAYVEENWHKLLKSTAQNYEHIDLDVLEICWMSFSFEIWARMYLDQSPIDYKHCVF